MTPSKSEITKTRILETATRLFAEKSFESVSVRSIARVARVDPALIHHYFGSKNDLFSVVLSHAAAPDEHLGEIASAQLNQLGEELVRAALKMLESPAGAAVQAMIRSGISSHPKLLKAFIEQRFLRKISDMLPGPEHERRQRTALAGTQFAGLLIARYVVKIEPLASMDREEVITAVAPNIQRYLTGDIHAQKGA
jgi:AcrR family transcriptional regulator